MIKVLWSDDIFENKADIDSSIDNAYSHDILMVPKQTWDEAQNELEIAGNTYDVVILDGMGQRAIDSKTNDKSHLTNAIRWLSEEKGRGKIYPIIIYTGFYEAINELYTEDENIFAIIKKPELSTLYNKIKEAVIGSQNLKIRVKYDQVWGIFTNSILSSQKESTLLSLIKKSESNQFDKSDFNSIRDIFEALLKRFNDLDNTDAFLPNDILNEDGRINLELSLRILKGLKTNIEIGGTFIRTIPSKKNSVIPYKHHIGYCFDFVKETSSALSHDYPAGFGKTTSVACLNALLEILSWSNKYVVSKYSHLL